MSQINVRLQISDYANRVLGVVKEKFGLRDKSEAFDKVMDMYGEEFAEKEPKEEIVKDLIKSTENHIKKYGFRKMNNNDLKKLFEMK